jgi:hypothetical protein
MIGFTPIASIVVREREFGWGPADRSANVLGCSQESLFSITVTVSNVVDDFAISCHVQGLHVGSV